jgi:hypothetical protein
MEKVREKFKEILRKNFLVRLLVIEAVIVAFAVLWMETLTYSATSVYTLRDARSDYYRSMEYESENGL